MYVHVHLHGKCLCEYVHLLVCVDVHVDGCVGVFEYVGALGVWVYLGMWVYFGGWCEHVCVHVLILVSTDLQYM